MHSKSLVRNEGWSSTQAKKETSILCANVQGAREHVHRLSIELSAKTNVTDTFRDTVAISVTQNTACNSISKGSGHLQLNIHKGPKSWSRAH